MMENLEQYIYAKLDSMQTEKAQSAVVPMFVTKGEILGAVVKDARKVLNKMYIENRLKVHPTKDASVQDFIELIKEN